MRSFLINSSFLLNWSFLITASHKQVDLIAEEIAGRSVCFCFVLSCFDFICFVLSHHIPAFMLFWAVNLLPSLNLHRTQKRKHVGTNSFSNLCFWVDFVILSSLFILGALGCWQMISKYMYKHICTQTTQTPANTHIHTHTHTDYQQVPVFGGGILWICGTLGFFSPAALVYLSPTHTSHDDTTHTSSSHVTLIKESWRTHKAFMKLMIWTCLYIYIYN